MIYIFFLGKMIYYNAFTISIFKING